MSRHLLVACTFLLFTFPLTAQTKNAPAPTARRVDDSSAQLPVKRVVLYKNGVGYFEHSARVHGNQELNIDFTTAQLNDVLKSLTVVDLGEGRISSVRYNSIAPLDERLKALRLPFGQKITRADYLAALRGARVEVHSGPVATAGRLLSVENEQRTADKTSYVATLFSVVTDTGEMRNFELGPGISVRLTDRDLNEEVGRYMNLISSSRASDLRRMTITDSGAGDREVAVSYISEVPIWKSTYRIILSEKPNVKPLLQGWAIVDNTVGEDWKNVQLALVAGSPQSFVQQISQPYYARRPVVELPQSVMLTPQSHEGTLTTLPMNGREFDRLDQFAQLTPGISAPTTSLHGTVHDMSGAVIAGARVTVRNEETGASQSTTTDANGNYLFNNVQAGNSALFVSYPNFKRFELTQFYLGVGRMNEIDARLEVGGAQETVTVEASAVALNTENASISALAAKQHIEAEGKALGDYFEYNLSQPITIGKNQSALVPILQARIDAEKVSLWNEESKEIRRALWLTNSSNLTLDAGTFNIVEGEAFSGEGTIETIHPAERRLISYAADPALRIGMDEESTERPATHVRIAKGVMILTREQRDSRTYTLHNSDTQPRQVVIEHLSREGWKLAEGAKPEETSASYLRFRVAVGPGKTGTLKIEEYHPEDTQYELSELDDDEVKLISEQPLTPAVRDAIRRVLDQKNEVDRLGTQVSLRQHEIDSITKDQARLRENMKALKGSAEEKALLQRYTRELDSQEDRINTLNKDISNLQDQKSKAEDQLDQTIQQIAMDETL
jgi:hypothetical protein